MALKPPDPVYTFKGNMTSVHCVLFDISPDHELLHVGTQSGKIHTWDLKTNREIHSTQIGDEACLAIHKVKDNVLITQEKTGKISKWVVSDQNWALQKTLETEHYGFCKCAISENKLYTPIRNGTVQEISVDAFLPQRKFFVAELQLGEVMVLKPFKLREDYYLLAGYESGHIFLWNETQIVSQMKINDCVMALDFEVESMQGICGSTTEKLLVFVLKDSLEFSVRKEIVLTNAGVASVAIKPDKRIVVVGGWDRSLRLYSWKKMKALAVLDFHNETVQDVCFSKVPVAAWESKCLMAAGGKDCRVSLWDLYN